MNIEKPTIKDISNYVKKNENTISGWSTKQPDLLEIVKLGAFCKKNNISIQMIKSCVVLQEMVKNSAAE